MESIETLPTVETAKKLGLLPEEYDRIQEILGRKPNFTELSIFSVMWSEHCSYKNSIVWLKTLPKDSPRMLAKAGEENAGLVDLGDGLGCAFKIESHNHPSALEPYQGAATGVGGINRDIFTMGARPIAQLNSLRFGNIDLAKTKWLVKGVVKGIGDYGNAFGIPTVGGEVQFDDCYNVNPLVNAFSAGILKVGTQASAISYGVGNPVFIVGSATGKDGIGGASFASEDITAKSSEKLPAVQVGDPFQEKLLLEASLEIIEAGCVIGIQDMGAAGIICSTSEMSAKGEHGMIIDLSKVPTRQPNMQPFEILLSESQERMLIVVEKGREEEAKRIFDKWDLNCEQIGTVTDTKRLQFYQDGVLVADVPADDLVLGGGAPVYHREYKEPAYFQEFKKFKIDSVADLPKEELPKALNFMMNHPNIASKKCHDRRTDKKDRSLSVNLKNGVYNCHYHGCEFSGCVADRPQKIMKKDFTPPVPRPQKVSDKVLRWFEDVRGISNNTLLRMKITENEEWFSDGKQMAICFNYFRDEKLVNIKFRTADKKFKMSAGAELIPYNLNAAKGEKELYWVEGEIDLLTCIECGIYNVVSVPNGASGGEGAKLEYIDNSWREIQHIEKHIICVDNDEAGKKLRDALSFRLGAEKCWYITYPDEAVVNDKGEVRTCKDLNEVLVNFNKDKVREVVATLEQPKIAGVHYVEDIADDIFDVYANGRIVGETTHLPEFDKIFKWKKGDINLVFGHGNFGKTQFWIHLMVIKSIYDGWRWAIF